MIGNSVVPQIAEALGRMILEAVSLEGADHECKG